MKVEKTDDGVEIELDGGLTLGVTITPAADGPHVRLAFERNQSLEFVITNASGVVFAERLLRAVIVGDPPPGAVIELLDDEAMVRLITHRYLGRWHEIEFADRQTITQLALDVGRLVGLAHRLLSLSASRPVEVGRDAD